MRFQDRGVVVTGGGSGIGQQVCYAAAEEGARVAVGDLDSERAEATAAEIRRRKGEATSRTPATRRRSATFTPWAVGRNRTKLRAPSCSWLMRPMAS
jgi:NAD(P)-dependent dehydrogenase (short-subunit alcohol dehydrogenase family)